MRAKFDCRIHFGKTKITSVVLRQTKQHLIKKARLKSRAFCMRLFSCSYKSAKRCHIFQVSALSSAPDRRAVNSEYSRYFAMSESAPIAIYNFDFGFGKVHLPDFVVYSGVIFFRCFIYTGSVVSLVAISSLRLTVKFAGSTYSRNK